MIEEHKIDPSPFATHHFALGDIEEAYDVFADAATTHALKVVLAAEPVEVEPTFAREPATVGV